jgi:hypothetical protein
MLKRKYMSGYSKESFSTTVLDSRLTDGSEIVSLTVRSISTPTKIPGTHLCRFTSS